MRDFSLLILCSFAILAHAAEKPIWAKAATLLPGVRNHAAPEQIVSPDGKVVLQVRHRVRKGDDDLLYIHVEAPKDRLRDVDLDEGAHEILWAPDSSAFLVNGSTSGYAGFFTTVYQFGPDGFRKLHLTEAAQQDMVTSFPPCKASYRSESLWKKIASNPELNMSGLSWIGPSQIVVIAEVPCVSTYGGIMCQIQGSVLNVPDGRIVERLTARELKTRWQKSMAWSMHIPDQPAYGPALTNDPFGR